jgi:hypothetical protein
VVFFPRVLILCDPRTGISKALDDHEVDGEHEDRALQSNHHFLPRELNFAWRRGRDRSKREIAPRAQACPTLTDGG